MNDNQSETNNPQQPVAFCQNCGKSLDNDSIRKVGSAVYCEPCLAARIGTPPAPGYTPVNAGMPSPGAPPAWSTAGFNTPGPNPGLAALLGLIPGVGAMYNEQYAKGVVHLIIFALLVSFSHITGIFILFVFGWIAYMSIEAHHTAKARLEGTPLPNPFGFNDIGERMGFGTAWPGVNPTAAARDAVKTVADHLNTSGAGFQQRQPVPPAYGPIITPPPVPNPPPPSYADAYSQNLTDQINQRAHGYTAPHNPYVAPPYAPVSTAVPPYAPPFTPPYVPAYVPPPSAPSRFPVGAVVLIGLGMVFLLGTMGLFRALPGASLVGVILLGIGAWIFFSRMTDTGLPLHDDDSSHFQLRLLRALRSSIWLIFIGILVLLDAFHIVRWSYSWPTIIILAGVMMIIQRTVYANAAAAYPYPPGAPSSPGSFTSGQGGVSFAEANDRSSHPADTDSVTRSTEAPDTHEGGI